MGDDILSGLNPVQREAVTHHEGPLLVVAGAGSGKTRVLTHRVGHLIRAHDISPFAVLAITFTNKAADEMKQRIAALVGPVAEKMWVSTFHAACVRILRREAPKLGYPSSFTIYDQADAVRLTGYVIRDIGLDPKRFPPRSVHATISAAKNDFVAADEFAEHAGALFERKIGDVYREYQARLERAGAMDFDDLLMTTARLFRSQPDVLEHYQRRFEHVLVDEYQDTNRVQNELVVQLGREHRNVCVVGDSDQCLPPGTLVQTPNGARAIETLRRGDAVFGTGAHGRLVPSEITDAHRGRYAGRLYRIHAGGRVLTGTPHHIVLADAHLEAGRSLVYLVHRDDGGYQVGVTQSGDRRPLAGLAKLWILQVCDSREEAARWACLYAARLDGHLDAAVAAKQIMEDLDLHPDFPHAIAEAISTGFRSLLPHNGVVRLTMFADGVGGHRVEWAGHRNAHHDYREALDLALAVAQAGGLDIQRRAQVNGKTYPFLPLSHLRVGMSVLIEQDGGVIEAAIEAVDVVDYDGSVYDLEVSPTHTYLADGVLV
ncbi:MAG: UvrD-helicase domain-containing protein, partial [Acidimicrobiales bacterium]